MICHDANLLADDALIFDPVDSLFTVFDFLWLIQPLEGIEIVVEWAVEEFRAFEECELLMSQLRLQLTLQSRLATA